MSTRRFIFNEIAYAIRRICILGGSLNTYRCGGTGIVIQNKTALGGTSKRRRATNNKRIN